MNKWHINKNGVPAPCKASEGKCPLNSKHFSNKGDAQIFNNQQMEGQFGILPNQNSFENREKMENRKKMSEVIERISGVNATGFKYETYASLAIAEEMGLDRITVFENNEILISLHTGDSSEVINAKVHSERSTKALLSYYKKMGVNIKDESKLIRVMYHNEDINKGILVQSGGPNVLDAAVIKADEVVDIIEMKELSQQAQLPTTSLETQKDGSISEESLSQQKDYMKNALKNAKIQDADGKDFQVDFGNAEDNQRLPLRHFVEKYREKGAISFVYTTNNGEDVHRMSLLGETDEVVDKLIDNNIEANIKLRANLNKHNVNEDDIYRFDNILSKKYFKSGRSSSTKSFTLQSVREDKISRAGKYVRIGGYVLPIEYDTYKENMTKRIKKTELSAFGLVLTGNVKIKY